MGAPALAPRRQPARKAPARRAPSRRAPARRTTARKAAPRRKPRPNRALASRSRGQGIAQPALAGAALIPHAAVSAAGAVRDLSDSSLIVRLTAGRGWIAVLCALLGGIVALNVVSLSINATSGRVGLAIEEYERQNSSLRAELAEKLSAGQVEDAAAGLGLTVAATGDVSRRLRSPGGAARRRHRAQLRGLLGRPHASPLDRGGAARDVQPAPGGRAARHSTVRQRPARERPAGGGPAGRGRQPHRRRRPLAAER